MPGGARPRFALSPVQPGRARRDPRAERRAALVPGTVRPRLDRSGAFHATAVAPSAPPAAPAVRIIAAPDFLILVVTEADGGRLSRHERQTLGAARRLADAGGGAVVLVSIAPPEAAGAAGADRLVALPQRPGYDPEGSVAALAALVADLAPRHVLFPENGGGGDLARRLAARLEVGFCAGAESLSPREAIRPVRAGRGERRDPPPRLITIAPDRLAPHSGAVHEARPLPMPQAAPPRRGILAAERIAVAAENVPLAEAAFVVAAGHGVTDFPAFLRLCRALGATPGASRVVCDAGQMPRATQVGASGTVLDAACYVAFGIAGAPQHLQGLGRVERVAAVNTDLHAAMIARAELAIVQDAQKVMPALIALIEAGG